MNKAVNRRGRGRGRGEREKGRRGEGEKEGGKHTSNLCEQYYSRVGTGPQVATLERTWLHIPPKTPLALRLCPDVEGRRETGEERRGRREEKGELDT